MPKNSNKLSLPPRLQKKGKQGQEGGKLNKTLKQPPLKEGVNPPGLLSVLANKARDFVKPRVTPPAQLTDQLKAKPQKLATGGVAKIRLEQSTSSGQQNPLKPKKGSRND